MLWSGPVDWQCTGQISSLHQQPGSRLRCYCTATDSETKIVGTLGGRDIVSAGSVNPQDFFVKTITKGGQLCTLLACFLKYAHFCVTAPCKYTVVVEHSGYLGMIGSVPQAFMFVLVGMPQCSAAPNLQ